MDVFFPTDDRQEYLCYLKSASKHALDFLAWCLMREPEIGSGLSLMQIIIRRLDRS